MMPLAIAAGVLLVVFTLWDGFETMILPRRVARRFRVARYVYLGSWALWRGAARLLPRSRRESALSFYGPLSLIFLLGVWAALLIFGYSFIYWGTAFTPTGSRAHASYLTDLYYSGTTFFTLGLGDITSEQGIDRTVTVFQAATGFGLLALVIGYLPVLYQAFSRRELRISRLDARAGSPPTAGTLFARFPPASRRKELEELLEDWELWAAELLESHLSFPVLAYFRSQHDHQSWVAALTMILDATAVLCALEENPKGTRSWLTFAMARHAAVDLAQIFHASTDGNASRLPANGLERLRDVLGPAWPLDGTDPVRHRLGALCESYEPLVAALGRHFEMELPGWLPAGSEVDDWATPVALA